MIRQLFTSERNIMIAIAINAIVIFLLYFPSINTDADPNHLLISIDHIFALVFLLEAVVKISTNGRRAYFADPWNIFDFAIVVVSLPSLLSFIPSLAIFDYGFLKILRLFRLVRLLRLMQFIPGIGKILSGLTRALKASVFVIIALVFLNFILALFTCHFYGELAPEYFGDPAISSYTIFQMFTVEGWNEIPAVLAERVEKPMMAGIARFYFVLVVLVGGIFGMSLANAVFVDEMTMDNNAELEAKIDAMQQEIQKEMSEIKALLKNSE